MTYATGYDLIKRAASDGVQRAAGSDLTKQTFFNAVVGNRSKEFVQDLWILMQYQKEKHRLTGRCGKVICSRDYMNKIETQVFGKAQSWVSDCESYYDEVHEGLTCIANYVKGDLRTSSFPIKPDYRDSVISIIQYLDKQLGTGIEKLLTVHHMPQYAKKKNETEFQQSIEHLKIWSSHTRVKDYREWSNYDALDYVMQKVSPIGDDILYLRKSAYVYATADVIKSASDFYGVPSLLIAGVAYNEFGGDPPIVDDAKYVVSKLTPDFLDGFGVDIGGQKLRVDKNTSKVSFGNISMQLRRAAETLGYYEELTTEQEQQMIELLRDDRTAIFLVAGHLRDLMQIDFPGVNPNDLTVDEMKVIIGRYNVGPDVSKEFAGNCGYALAFEKRIEKLRALIN